MIKSVSAIRERTLVGTLDMLEQLRRQISSLPTSEPDAICLLQRPQVFELSVELTNFIMTKFGHAPSDPGSKFDKTRRAMNKIAGRGLRGERRYSETSAP